MKITKGMIIKVLLISYKFTNKTVSSGNLGKIIKDYYEKNSRQTISIELKYVSYTVPFPSSKINEATSYVKKLMPAGFDVYIHFCNPVTSHTGGGNIITYASAANSIHEFGHALGLSHANLNLTGVSMGSRDPFDQMTIFAPYPSTNAVHRYQLGWFLDSELINYDPSKSEYTIGMLKNLSDMISAKVVLYRVNDEPKDRLYFISYGSKKEKKKDTFYTSYITIHTIRGINSSFLIGMYKVEKDRIYTNSESGLIITPILEKDDKISINIKTISAKFSICEHDIENCDENCELEQIINDDYEENTN